MQDCKLLPCNIVKIPVVWFKTLEEEQLRLAKAVNTISIFSKELRGCLHYAGNFLSMARPSAVEMSNRTMGIFIMSA
ncbi:hypothetical protein ACLOJK_019598 [Asimina triloba]